MSVYAREVLEKEKLEIESKIKIFDSEDLIKAANVNVSGRLEMSIPISILRRY